MIDGLNTLAESWAKLMWTASWQICLLVLLVWIIARFSKWLPSKIVVWMWRLVFVKLVVLLFVPCIELPILAMEQQATQIQLSVGTSSQSQLTASIDRTDVKETLSTSTYCFMTWMIGSVGGFLWLLHDCYRVLLWRRKSLPVDDPTLIQICHEVKREMGIWRSVSLRLSNDVQSPVVTGIFCPSIIFPEKAKFTTEEKRLLLAHELSHVKNCDLKWILLATTLCRCCFLFHPLMWFAIQQLRVFQELTADELATSNRNVASYAKLLLRVLEENSVAIQKPHLAIGFHESFYNLRRRLTSMKRNRMESKFIQRTAFTFLIGITIVGVIPWKLVAQESKPTPKQSEKTESLPKKVESQKATHLAKVAIKQSRLKDGEKSEQTMETNVGFIACDNFKIETAGITVEGKQNRYHLEIHSCTKSGVKHHLVRFKLLEQENGKKEIVLSAPTVLMREDENGVAHAKIISGKEVPLMINKERMQVLFEGIEIEITISEADKMTD